MKALYDLKDKLCDEINKIARKPDISASDLETVHKFTDSIKNIDKICMLEEKGYSEDGYSRDGSREHMLLKLEDMMHDADSEKTKSAIRKCINEIERN